MTTAVLTATGRAAAIHWETSLFAPSRETVVRTEAAGEQVSARAAYQLVLHARAVLVDIRAQAQRLAHGTVAPRLRPVVADAGELLDGRFGHGTHVLVLCQEGYAAQLTAAALAHLGVRAAAVVGGLDAWRAAGLPTVSGDASAA